MACCPTSCHCRGKRSTRPRRWYAAVARMGRPRCSIRKRELIGERAWSALFQQTPLPSGGRLFSIDRIATAYSNAKLPTTVRAWDLAATGETGRNDPDWTVGIKLSRDSNGRYLIHDVVRFRGTPHQVEELIVTTAQKDGAKVRGHS